MTSVEFNKLLDEYIIEDRKVGDAKGADYTIGNTDRLANFKWVGGLVCCASCQKPIGTRAVFGVYFLKHIFAILAWVRTGQVESEGLKGRFTDTRIYSVLGAAIAKEEEVPF